MTISLMVTLKKRYKHLLSPWIFHNVTREEILTKTRGFPELVTYRTDLPDLWASDYADPDSPLRFFHPSRDTALEFHELFARDHHLTQEDQ